MPTNEEFRIRLSADVERTRKAYSAALERFNAVTSEGAGALPHPDGIARTTRAGRAVRFALRDYSSAMLRMSRFLITGVPDSEPKDPPTQN